MSNKPNTRPEQEALEADEDDEEIRVTLSMDDDSEVECRILTNGGAGLHCTASVR